MSVAIVVASKHGSTREIGEEIARNLRHFGIGSTLYDAKEDVKLQGRTGAIVGSAIYVGKWMKEARSFLETNQQQLGQMPVWLFSSGPIGDQPPEKALDAKAIEELMAVCGARDHQVFYGKLDPADLSRTERLVTKLVHAPEGDFRDFEAIDGWAEDIATVLLAERSASATTE